MGNLRQLRIDGPAGQLEAVYRAATPASGAAVLAHPHPLYGGTMHHPVLFHADRRLNRAGFATLRFNFRGVGESEGGHDDGRGEVEDVGAAVAWLRESAPNLPLIVVGYSFGASCGLRYCLVDRRVAALVAVGMPIRLYPSLELERVGRPLAVVQGSEDEFGSPEELRALLGGACPAGRLYVLDGADHFFTGRATEAADRIVAAARTCLEEGAGST